MNQSLSRCAVILLLPLCACNAEPQRAATQAAPGSAVGDPAIVHHPQPPARPAQKIDSLQIEGTYERFTARLVQPNSSMPFSTYLPKDMVFEPASSGEGEGFYFYTNFAGRRNENAFMLVFLLPPGTGETEARQLAHAFTTSRSKSGQVTNIAVHNRDDRFFYVAHAYPPEYGDGFAPRAHYIRKQWVWLNDGSGL